MCAAGPFQAKPASSSPVNVTRTMRGVRRRMRLTRTAKRGLRGRAASGADGSAMCASRRGLRDSVSRGARRGSAGGGLARRLRRAERFGLDRLAGPDPRGVELGSENELAVEIHAVHAVHIVERL